MPVIDFIKWVRVEADAAGRFRSRALMMAVRDTSTYRDALHRMLAARVHRLYVEDGTGALVGVVSIKDIISHIVQRLSAP